MAGEPSKSVARKMSFELDIFEATWNERFEKVHRFVRREVAATRLFTLLGEMAGVEYQKELTKRDQLPVVRVGYLPIRLMDEGFPTLWLSEAYHVFSAPLEVDGRQIATLPTRSIGAQVLRVTHGGKEPTKKNTAEKYARECIDDFEKLLEGNATEMTPLHHILEDSPATRWPNNSVKLQQEQNQYVSWLVRGAVQHEISVPVELLT